MERIRSRAKSKLWRGTDGFTIIETMIVLAVSGGLLVSVMATISGQQQKTQFTTGVRDFETKIQDVVNDVQTGYYPNNGTTKCTNDPASDTAPVNDDAAMIVPQGTNENCIFLGKGIHFHSPDGNRLVNFRTTTIAGKRQTNKKDITSISEAKPIAFNKSGNGVDTDELLNGIELTEIKIYKDSVFTNPPDTSVGLGIMTSIKTGTSSSGLVGGASGRPNLAFIRDVSAGDNDGTQFSDKISTIADADLVKVDGGAVFCLRDGSRGRAAAVTLGIRLTGKDDPLFQSTGQTLSTQVYFDADAEKFGCAV